MLILRGHEDAVRCLGYSPDRRYLATGSEDATVRLWDLIAGGMLRADFQHPASVEALAFDSNGKTLFTGTAEGALLACHLARNRMGLSERAHAHGVRCMVSIADGDLLVTASWDQTVKMWEASTLQYRGVLQQESSCSTLACSPDGKSIALGNEDGTIKLYHRGSVKGVALAEGDSPLFALAWSPNGRVLATGHANGSIALREGTNPPIWLRGHNWTVYSLAFTPDSRTLISGSADGTVRQWDVASGREKRCYRWHTSWVTCVAVAPDGMTAAAGSADHTAVVWDLDE